MAREHDDVIEPVSDLSATEASDEAAEQVKGGGTDVSGRTPQRPPTPQPINVPRPIDPCW